MINTLPQFTEHFSSKNDLHLLLLYIKAKISFNEVLAQKNSRSVKKNNAFVSEISDIIAYT